MEGKDIKIGEEFCLDDGIHYVSEIKDGEVVLKTWKELWAECNCRRCHFFQKDKGWLSHEKPKDGEKMPMVLSCRLGQFKMTHNPVYIPKLCKLKNFVYEPQKEVSKVVNEALDRFSLLKKREVSRMIIPSYGGVEIIDVKTMNRMFKRVLINED